MAFTSSPASISACTVAESRIANRRSTSLRAPRARGLACVPRAAGKGAADDGSNPYVGRKEAQEAARKALMGALGNKRDVLSQFDNGGKGGGPIDWFFGGRGGGGGGDSSAARKISYWIFLVLLVLFAFKPVTAVIVNGVYYAFGWRTGREPPTEAELAAAAVPTSADADVLKRYGASDDDDDDDDE